mmetsp:Transcript_50916/g.94877  ORF Transcript_50916/g.94877 Transcript_50916/m.94877 type:complete len:431 (+) Transcript_50916:325-1617(+)
MLGVIAQSPTFNVLRSNLSTTCRAVLDALDAMLVFVSGKVSGIFPHTTVDTPTRLKLARALSALGGLIFLLIAALFFFPDGLSFSPTFISSSDKGQQARKLSKGDEVNDAPALYSVAVMKALQMPLHRPGCRKDHLQETNEGSVQIAPHVVTYTLERIRNATVHGVPYEHMYIHRIFEPDFYACIIAHLPPGTNNSGMTKLKSGNSNRHTVQLKRQDLVGPTTESSDKAGIDRRFWTAFATAFGAHEMSTAFLQKFERTIVRRLKAVKLPPGWGSNFENKTVDGVPPSQSFTFEMDISRDVFGYNIKPHTDTVKKWVTVLWYLPTSSELASSGTLIVRSKSNQTAKSSGGKKWSDDFEVFKTAEYVPNSVVAFAPCYSSWHAVRATVVPNMARDTIQSFVHMDEGRSKKKPKVKAKGACASPQEELLTET